MVTGSKKGRPRKSKALEGKTISQVTREFLISLDPKTNKSRLSMLLNALQVRALDKSDKAAEILLNRAYGQAPQIIQADVRHIGYDGKNPEGYIESVLSQTAE